MEFWIKAAQLILSLSILVTLHEFGHFIPARLFKTRVEKFYLFFNPWFSLFKYKKGETEWGLGWLPLGGYVKIAGMIDESMDKEQMAKEPEEWEFRAKPAWQRLIIMVGGVTVNLILGFLIYMMVLFTWGREELPVSNLKYGITADSLAQSCGLQPGDHIVEVQGKKDFDYMALNRGILLRGLREFTVERNGEHIKIQLPEDVEYRMNEVGKRTLFEYRILPVVDTVIPDMPAAKAGLKKGDVLVAVDGKTISYYDEFQEYMRLHKKGSIALLVKGKDGAERELSMTPNEEHKVGFAPMGDPEKLFGIRKVSYSFFEAIPKGFSFGLQTLGDYVYSLKFLFTSSGAKQLGGFGTIGSMFSPTWDWQSFWMLTAFLSIVLAFMNILPIPALDGGHVMFLLWEMITGKPPRQRVMEIMQIIGMVLLLGLILFANFNDLLKLF